MSTLNTEAVAIGEPPQQGRFRIDVPNVQAQLYKALAEACAAMSPLVHDAENEHQRFGYTKGDTMIGSGSRCLAHFGLSLTVIEFDPIPAGDPREVQNREGRKMTVQFYMCQAKLRLDHEAGGTIYMTRSLPAIPGFGRPEDKAICAAETTLLAYCYRSVLGIERPDSDDDIAGRDDTGWGAPTGPPPRSDKPQSRRKISESKETRVHYSQATNEPEAVKRVETVTTTQAIPQQKAADEAKPPKLSVQLANLMIEKGQAASAAEAAEIVKIWGRQYRSRPTQANIREAMAQVDRGEMLLEAPEPLTMTDVDVDAAMAPPTAAPNGEDAPPADKTYQDVLDLAGGMAKRPQLVVHASKVGLVFDENMPPAQMNFMCLQIENGTFKIL